MLKRTLTALLLIPPIVYLVGWSPVWLFLLAVVVAVVLALREYFALCRAMGFKVFSWIGYGAAWRLRFAGIATDVAPGGDFVDRPLYAAGVGAFVATAGLRRSMDFKDYLAAGLRHHLWGLLYRPLSFVPVRHSLFRGLFRR